MSRVTYANTPSTADQEVLRSAHGVRIITAEEEGTGVNVLPAGVYGFTYSPGLANTPLWAVRRFRTYEIHKLGNGDVFVTGFADVDTAAKIASSEDEQVVQIRPEPDAQASVLVKIPYARIRRHHQYAAPNQDGFTVRLAPVVWSPEASS